MTLDEYIAALQKIKNEQEDGGELEVVDEQNDSLDAPEFNNDDPDEPCVVVCSLA